MQRPALKGMQMSDLLSSIDARTRLAGTNKLEILLFALGLDSRTGRRETFGINVFKVREVMRTPPITSAPDMPAAVKGMVSLRGALVPVVDLADYIGMQPESPREIMIVTEYNGKTQGFLVESVDTILRLDWAQMRVPPQMLTSNLGGLVTAVTELPDGCLVMMLDVERVLAETDKVDDAMIFSGISSLGRDDLTILFADDSSVARGQIERTLERPRRETRQRRQRRAAWDELLRIATATESSGKPAREGLCATGADRCRNAGNGRLPADQEHQGRSALCRHPGDHAFLPFRRCPTSSWASRWAWTNTCRNSSPTAWRRNARAAAQAGAGAPLPE
jgi:two-component system chemotaxis response regulator CheV